MRRTYPACRIEVDAVAVCESRGRPVPATARAALVILEDTNVTEAERQIAADELARAAGWLLLPAGVPGKRDARP